MLSAARAIHIWILDTTSSSSWFGKRLPSVFWRLSTLLLEEFQLSLGVSARAVCTWRVRLGRSPRHAPVYGCSKVFPVPCARAVRTWNFVHYFPCPGSGSHCSGCLMLLMSSKIGFLRETTFFVGAMLGSTVDTCSASVLWLWTYFPHFLRCGRLKS